MPPRSSRHERASDEPELVSALRNPAVYPHRPAAVELRETHISWVFLAGDLAYKVKKPVVFPFLDYGTVERRRHLCHEEVRLNRRLAPEIYLGVVAIRPDAATGYALAGPDDAGAVEYAVEMRRVDEGRSLATLVSANELETSEILEVARLLARFHRQAPSAPPESCAATVASVRENVANLRGAAEGVIAARSLDASAGFIDAFLAAMPDAFEGRSRDGCFRECHGDLRAEHVIVPVGRPPYVYDCVEFDPVLRSIDVACDIAFLVMDLTGLGGKTHAEALLRAYRAAGGDPGDDSLVAFYAAYRARVRALVTCARRGELAPDDPLRDGLRVDATRLFELARAFEWRARRPLVLAICGVSGSGKTVLATEIARRSGWSHLSSDVVRKGLAGIERTERGDARHYTRDFTRLTYRELGKRARNCLDEAGGVIVDATFHLEAERRAFADGLGAAETPAVFLECRASAETLLERVARREREPGRVSDATAGVVRAQLAERESFAESPGLWLELETDAEADEVATEAELLLDGHREALASSHPPSGP